VQEPLSPPSIAPFARLVASARADDVDGSRLRALAALVSAAALAGCYAPLSCDDGTEVQEIGLRDVVLMPGGGFSVPTDVGESAGDRRAFASCDAFCSARTGVTRVRACEGPQRQSVDDPIWGVRCDVEVITCGRAEILRTPSGRHTEGFRPNQSCPRTLAEHFEGVAWEEAASIHAFRRLADELAWHGAPRELVHAARVAAVEECRHTRTMLGLARRHAPACPSLGQRPSVPPLPSLPRRRGRFAPRDLERIAVENAVEGCVGETVAAALASFQAENAADPEIREAMATIAREEITHAALALRVLAWTDSRLPGRSRARVRRALASAAREVTPAALAGGTGELRQQAGLPTSRQARRLLAALALGARPHLRDASAPIAPSTSMRS